MVQPLSHDPLDSRRVSAAAVAARASRGLWLWLAIVVVLAGTPDHRNTYELLYLSGHETKNRLRNEIQKEH